MSTGVFFVGPQLSAASGVFQQPDVRELIGVVRPSRGGLARRSISTTSRGRGALLQLDSHIAVRGKSRAENDECLYVCSSVCLFVHLFACLCLLAASPLTICEGNWVSRNVDASDGASHFGAQTIECRRVLLRPPQPQLQLHCSRCRSIRCRDGDVDGDDDFNALHLLSPGQREH